MVQLNCSCFKKTEVEPFNITEYVTNLTTIWADLSQAYLLVLLATRQLIIQ